MPLKSLTLNGFKSFADKTKIEFTSGITGIVGPNGSGKSNITEGIRWVMGEQSAKNLRGDKMSDVIFAGSSIRPSMNRAEVVFEFNNTNHDLKSDFDKITIKRRLFRDGTSEFSINNKKCRLKDITELFLDSGLGRESFSIISQGRVEAIFNSKPIERRSIIEESAGVALYKQKKHEAEIKLIDTDDNLNRVSDILHELSVQVEPLKQQASIAHDYLEQKKEYDKIYQKILAIEIFELDQNRQKHIKKAESIKIKADKIDYEVESANKSAKANQLKITDLSQQIDEKNKLLLDLSTELEILNGKKAVSEERNIFNEKNQAELKTQISEYKKVILNSEQELSNSLSEYDLINTQARELKDKLSEINSDKDMSPEKIHLEIENLRSEYLNMLQEQTTANNNINFLITQKNRISELIADNKLSLVKKNEESASKEQDILKIQTQLKEYENNNSELTQEFQIQKEQKQKLVENIDKINLELTKYLSLLQQSKAKYQALKELSEDHAGFFQGVKAVLNNKSKFNGIIGAVAELIKVPQEFQIAVEVASGNQLQSIITENEESAKKAIEYLRRGNFGRATFLPKNVIKSRKISEYKLNNINHKGYLGVASELIAYPESIKNIIENIFGNLLIAENLDVAVEIAKSTNHQFRIVTLQGDILNPGGSLTGGQIKRSGSNILNRTQELVKLEKNINILKKKTSTLQDSAKSANTQLNELENKLKHSADLIADFLNNKRKLKQELDLLIAEKNRISQDIRDIKFSEEKNQNELNEATKKSELLQTNLKSINQKLDNLKETTVQKNNLLENYDQQQSVLNERIQTYKTQVTVVENNLNNKKITINRLKSDIDKETKNLKVAEDKLQKIISEQNNITDTTHNNGNRIKELTLKIEDTTQSISEFKKLRTSAEIESKKLTETVNDNYQLQKSISEEQENTSINLTKVNNLLNSKLEILRQDYQITFEAVYNKLDVRNIDIEELNKKMRMLKMSISELGSVNISAIEEYDKVKDRYEFLKKQETDLVTARSQLKEIMIDMDAEVSNRFEKTFTEVAAAFEVIFPDMFAGGKAKLILTDPSNLLETGIEIVAQPPGKKFQRLSLLSGGERALTAIALLFAIIKVNPVPFCILDEVEASLDDANVYRFAKYLNRYDADTQFIVITHRKGTMMNVDRLYGVSMGEVGISKMVSVEVKENNG